MRIIPLILMAWFTNTLSAQEVVYPLSVGDKWQYFAISVELKTYLVEYEMLADTIMPNGHHYALYVQTRDGQNQTWIPEYYRQQGNQVLRYSPPHGKE